MSVLRRIFVACTFAVGAFGLLSVANAGSAEANCEVNITFKNKESRQVTVDLSESKVKVRGGLWKKIGSSTLAIRAKGSKTTSPKLLFNCGAKRRYKFDVTKGGSNKVIYYPSVSGWTTRQSFTVNIDF